MVGALAKALARQGHRVGVVTPLYAGIRERFLDIKPFEYVLEVPLGSGRVRANVLARERSPGLTLYFLDQPEFFHRDGLYQKEWARLSRQRRALYLFFQSRPGKGLFYPPNTSAAMNAAPRNRLGIASGTLQLFVKPGW